MIEINYKILELLTEEEIQLVCKNSEIDIFLKVFKDEKDKNKYKKYTQKLGRLDKKSNMAQTFCPIFAFELYKKGDTAFVNAIAKSAEYIGGKCWESISAMEPNISVEAMSTYTDEKLTELYIHILHNWKGFTTEVFYLALKINGVVVDPSRIENINNKILFILQKEAQEEEISKKIDDEKKKTEKELTQRFIAEKEKLLRDNRALAKSIEDLKKQNEEIKEELQKLKDREEKEKERYFEDLRKQIERELKAQKKEREDQLIEDIKAQKLVLVQSLKDEEKQKKQELDDRFDALIKEKETEVREYETRIEELKKSLQNSIDDNERLKNENEKLIEEQEQLRSYEQEYFRNVKPRLLQAELDRNLLEVVDKRDDIVAEGSGAYKKVPTVCEASFFAKDLEESQELAELDDFIQDFSDNIALVFDNSYEIATIVTAAFFNKKIIIIEDSIVSYIAGSLSALIDGRPFPVIEVNGAEKNVIVKEINNCDGKVIVINGVLGVYDEMLFSYICQECSDKYIFMTIPDVKDVELFSKSILYKSFILDIEKDYSFLSEEPLWIGKHCIDRFIEDKTKDELKKKYDKHFRNLVSSNLCGKVGAIELTKVLACYLQIMSDIGEVFSRGLRFYLDDRNIDPEELEKLLEKNGWK